MIGGVTEKSNEGRRMIGKQREEKTGARGEQR